MRRDRVFCDRCKKEINTHGMHLAINNDATTAINEHEWMRTNLDLCNDCVPLFNAFMKEAKP
jgi:hypothetical protein